MSSSDYIRVESIQDIDPNKLSVSYAGKKFIDKDNNRFSIRFNRETRRMEIVKILIRQGDKIQGDMDLRPWEAVEKMTPEKIHKNDAGSTDKNKEKLQQANTEASEKAPEPENQKQDKIQEKKYEKKPALHRKDANWNFDNYDLNIQSTPSIENAKIRESKTESNIQLTFDSSEDESFDSSADPTEANPAQSDEKSDLPISMEEKWKDKNERDKIDKLMKNIETTKTRINSVLINIKSSRIFEVTGDPSENQNIMGNLSREFDIEVFQNLDEIANYYKELISYPRALSYYTAKYERTRKNELSKADDTEKLHLVIRWEMQESFTKILEKLKALTLSLLDVLNMKNESHIKQLQYQHQLMFNDAKNATYYCSQDIESYIQEVEEWKYNT